MTRTALITGANKGIGYEIAARLGALGVTVLVGARDEDRRERAVEKLRTDGVDAHPVALDVTDERSVDRAAREITTLDILVNNAGIGLHGGEAPEGVDLAGIRKVFDTNVFGVIAVTEAMLPLLRRSSAGRIVNVSSRVGSFAVATDSTGPLADLPPSLGYRPSKTALNAITVQYANHLAGSGVLINAVCPGYVATDLTRHAGFRTPEQGAQIAVRLATVDDDGPNGRFFCDDGALAW